MQLNGSAKPDWLSGTCLLLSCHLSGKGQLQAAVEGGVLVPPNHSGMGVPRLCLGWGHEGPLQAGQSEREWGS